MNRTTEGSEQKAIIVGGETIPQEDGTIEIPPEQAKDFTQIESNIANAEIISIQVSGETNIEEVLSPKQIAEFKEARKEARPWVAEKETEIGR